MAREGPGRGRGQERIQEGSGPVRPIHLPALVLGRGAGPSLEVGDINHREAPVRVASGTKGKQSSKGQDFSPQAPGALRPTPATPGGQRWERDFWGSGLGSPLCLGEGSCHRHLDCRWVRGAWRVAGLWQVVVAKG